MPAISEVFMRLRVDSNAVKRDTEKGIDSADTRKAGKDAGTKFGKAFTPPVTRSAGGFSRHINFRSMGQRGGRQFGDGFTAEFSTSTVSAIGPSILGLGAKASFITLGGTLAAGLLPSLLGGLSAGVVAAGGIGTILLGAKGLIGNKKEQGPLYKAATSAGKQFVDAFQKSAAQLEKPLAKAFAEVPKIIKAIRPGLDQLFKGAGTLIQPLVGGLTKFAQVALPLLGEAFKAVAPLMRPLVDALTGIVQGLLPGMITLIKSSGPAVHALGSALADIAGGLGDVFRASAPAVKASSVLLTALGRVLRVILNVIGNLAVSAANALAPAFATFAKILDGLTPFLKLIGDLISMIAQAMLKDLNWALQGLLSLFQNIQPALTGFVQAISKAFWVLENSGAFQALGLALVQIVPLLSNLLNTVLGALSRVLPPVIKLFGQMADSLGSILAGALNIVLPVLSKLIVQALGVLAKILPVIIPPLLQMTKIVANALATAVARVLPLLLRLAEVALKGIAKLIPPLVPVIAALAAALVNGLANVLVTLLPLLTQLVTIALQGLLIILPVVIVPLKAFTRLLNAIPPALLTGIAVGIGAIALAFKAQAALVTLVNAGLKAHVAWSTLVRGATAAWTAAQWLLDAALSANPIALVVIAIAALAAGIAVAWTKSAGFRKVLIGAWNAIRGAMIAAWNAIYHTVIGPMVNFFAHTLPHWIGVAINWVRANWPLLLPILLGPVGAAAAAIIKNWHSIVSWAAWMWHQIVNIWHAIGNGLRAAWDWIWAHFVAPIGHAFTSVIPGWLGGAMRWINAHFIAPFKNAFRAGWSWVYKNVWLPFYRFITGTLPGWFGAAAKAIGGFWDKLKKSIGSPVYAVAHFVLSPLAGGLSKVLGWVGVHLNVKPLNDFIARIPHWSTGARLPGYGGGDTVPAMLEPGETVVSKEHSRLPFMQAAFKAAGVPGYQGGGIIGSAWHWLTSSNPVASAIRSAAMDFLKSVPGIGAVFSSVQDAYNSIPKDVQDALKVLVGLKDSGSKIFGPGTFGNAVKRIPAWAVGKVLGFLKGKIGSFLSSSGGGGLGNIPGGGSVSGAAKAAQNWAKAYIARVYHWTGLQWSALKNLWTGESGWNYRANNPSSGAYGIPQSLPGSKMAAAGKDWRTNPATQIRWGAAYIKSVYGSPLNAWGKWLNRNPHWYRHGGRVTSFDTGGRLPEDIFGIGPSGRQYQLHQGENVVRKGAQSGPLVQVNIPQVIVREMADIELIAQRIGATIAAAGLG